MNLKEIKKNIINSLENNEITHTEFQEFLNDLQYFNETKKEKLDTYEKGYSFHQLCDEITNHLMKLKLNDKYNEVDDYIVRSLIEDLSYSMTNKIYELENKSLHKTIHLNKLKFNELMKLLTN